MKTCFLLLLSICAALAVTVYWEYDTPSTVTFRVYQSQDIFAPYSEWQVVTVTSNLETRFDMQPGAMFFVVSASNFWGETFSAVVDTPTPPHPFTSGIRRN